jgi:hypothetical protein
MATDEVDKQTGGKSEHWVIFVTIANDERAMLFKPAHGAAVVMTGEGW